MRKINRAVKIRIYPNKEQITQIEKAIGCSRFLYNRYGQFLSMSGYKLEERGKYLIKVDRYFASSKICSVCGHKKKKLALSERIYLCECGNRMDRDVNAAVNILEEGKRIYKKCA